MPKWDFTHEKTALLVIDMQNDFLLEGAIMEVPKARKLVQPIKQIIDRCREIGVPVVYTEHETHPDRCPMEIANWPHLAHAGMRGGTKGVMTIDELAPLPGEPVVTKHRYSAFFETNLELILRNLRGGNNAVDTLIIVGIMSNICCESTARDAVYRDYKVVFGGDVTTTTCDDAHRATLANMEIFGRVLNFDEIMAKLA
ncbi:MAG: cysteine hydrolase [Oscillospiraceae bacterium]|nr:cysteine hydrolase [Oscillospiraceae bacterium]